MSEKVRCRYCQKMIRNSRWLGTIHVCVPGNERREIDHLYWQKRAQMQCMPVNLSRLG